MLRHSFTETLKASSAKYAPLAFNLHINSITKNKNSRRTGVLTLEMAAGY